MVNKNIDPEEIAFNNLKGKYKHFCLEYDGLAIDETCEEFKYCLCFTPHPGKFQANEDLPGSY